MNKLRRSLGFLVVLACAGWTLAAHAQVVITDTLTGATSAYPWQSFNGACLTAGTAAASSGSTIPACVGLSYYTTAGSTLIGGVSGTLPDPVGQGALRLTNGDNAATVAAGCNGCNESGAVVSNFTFPSTWGLQVSWTSVSYGGNAYNTTGADGMTFFLMDAATASGGSNFPTNPVGAIGGSLGYSCSNENVPYDGVPRGYIGVGMDEFGNFNNPGDNTDSGPGFLTGSIGLRGFGDTNWAALQRQKPTYYPSTLPTSCPWLQNALGVWYNSDGVSCWTQGDAVHSACSTGLLSNYAGSVSTNGLGGNAPVATTTPISTTYTTTAGAVVTLPTNDYQDLASLVLPNGTSISNQENVANPTRGNATPITYSLQITQNGILNFTYSVNGGTAQTVLEGYNIQTGNGYVPQNYRFGFSAGTGGGSNVHEITCFKAAPSTASGSSAGTNVQQSARVEAGTQVYLAYYHPINWWGQLTAQSLLLNTTTNVVSISPTANWDASCTLTGGSCTTTGGTNTATAPTARAILSWNGTTGIPFEWANLTTAQQNALTAGDSSVTSNRLNYLRGDRTKEVANGGPYRTRTSVLGDIVDSSPTWVGPPSAPYSDVWTDALYASAVNPENSGTKYSALVSAQGTRLNVVYVGANDGLLHGFRAGAYDASGNFVTSTTTPNDGVEVLAYAPATALATIHNKTAVHVDYSNPQYSHNFYVDESPGTGDLYYNGTWHTWLVGGTGFGGNVNGPAGNNTTTQVGSLFALDITDPTQFAESKASSLVLGEWSSSSTTNTLTCANITSCNGYLGSTVGTPIIRRLHNGDWAVLFGNGLDSANGTAGMFIMLVDSGTGNITFRYIDTGYGPSKDPLGLSSKNGIAYVSSADLDADHITDYVYAGDLFGNLWRFDLTGKTPSSWTVGAKPIFSTTAGQPITTRVLVDSVPAAGTSGAPRVIVSFGTGQQQPQTLTSSSTYATTTGQALYGIWDWNMNAWNALSTSSIPYATLTAPQTVTVAKLQAQSIITSTAASGSTPSYRTVTANPVCWAGSSSCTSGNTQYGWTLPLPATNEQIVYNPVMAYGMFIVNTIVPAVTEVLSCTSQPPSGYTMAVTVAGGGAAAQSFFGDANNNFVSIGGNIVSGIGLSGVGTPSIVTANGQPYLVEQTVSGTGAVSEVNPGANAIGGRLNWTKLR